MAFSLQGNNPYQGALLTKAAPPTAGPGGRLGGFVPAAPPDVRPGAIRRGRPTRGTNVVIPYARVVPVVADEEAGRDAANMKVPDKEQYAALHAGDIAFVKAATGPNDAHLQLGTSGHRQGRGVDRMQKLCSFEYLQQRAAVEATFKTATESAQMVAFGLLTDPDDNTLRQLAAYPIRVCSSRHQEASRRTFGRVAEQPLHLEAGAQHALDNEGLDSALALLGPFLPFLSPDLCKLCGGGYFAGVAGPATALDHPYEDGDGFGTVSDPAARQKLLRVALQEAGVFDWTPDGVVINKLYDSESPFSNDTVDARMGMLYNVAVQGPTPCKTFKALCPNMRNRTLPGDRLYVLVTAKVEEVRLVYFDRNHTEYSGGWETYARMHVFQRGALLGLQQDGFMPREGNMDIHDFQVHTGNVHEFNRSADAPATQNYGDYLFFRCALYRFALLTPTRIREEVLQKVCKTRDHCHSPMLRAYLDRWEEVRLLLLHDCGEQLLLDYLETPVCDIDDRDPPAGARVQALVARLSDDTKDALVDISVTAGWLLPQQAKVSEYQYELVGSQQLWTRSMDTTSGAAQARSSNSATAQHAPWKRGSRRVLGAWKIGNVLDSAAVPMVDKPDKQHMLNTAMLASRTFADRCNVQVEWVDGQTLARRYSGPRPSQRRN